MSMRVPIEQLEAFTRDCVLACGGSGEQAEIFSNALVWSDAIGRATHGVWRLPTYCKRLRLGLIKCPSSPRIESSHAAAVHIDGDQGFGHYVGHFAMQMAMERASQGGCGVALVRNSNHFGAAGYYVNLAAEQGMIGLALSNSTPRMAPHGGLLPVFGTNPLAFAAPLRNAKPILVDMATSAVSGARLIRQAESGEPIPAGIAVDKAGEPILDARKVDHGTLLPFGGAKGYGIALMIEILCGVLTGAGIANGVRSMFKDFDAPSNTGHLFLALEIERFFGRAEYDERMAFLCAAIRGSGPEAALPGEHRWALLAHNRVAGVPLDDRVQKALAGLARDLSVTFPWGRGVGLGASSGAL